MIIEEGQSEFALPEAVDLRYASFGVYSAGDPEQNPQSFLYRVCVVPLEEIEKMDGKPRGIPRLFSVRKNGENGPTLVWWPASDKKTVGVLEYMPPPKVL